MQARLTATELRQKPLVEERLKAIAAQLIAAHRRGDHAQVIPYASQAGLSIDGQAPHRLFMKAIQVFHPDRLSLVWERIESALARGDHAALESVATLLEWHSGRRVEPTVRFDPPEEDVGFDEEDFGFSVPPEPGDPEYNEEDDWDPDEGSFYSAVKRVLFGNLEFYPDPDELSRLDGELDLSDWDINDLDGIEHCRNLTSLNLSRNNIDNVYPLKALVKLASLDLAENDLEDADWLGGLSNLVELDLSANEIDDIAFLDRLPRLKYVDLSGNPIRNRAVLERLEARGVIVII